MFTILRRSDITRIIQKCHRLYDPKEKRRNLRYWQTSFAFAWPTRILGIIVILPCWILVHRLRLPDSTINGRMLLSTIGTLQSMYVLHTNVISVSTCIDCSHLVMCCMLCVAGTLRPLLYLLVTILRLTY